MFCVHPGGQRLCPPGNHFQNLTRFVFIYIFPSVRYLFRRSAKHDFPKEASMISGKQAASAISTIIATCTFILGASSAYAASDCKGMERGACEKSAACNWVDGYTRKDGAKVSGHCRKNPSQSGKKTSSSDKKK